MKYLLIFMTSFLFSQKNDLREKLFINLNKNEKSVICFGCDYKKSEIIKVVLTNNSRFDSIVFYFRKIKFENEIIKNSKPITIVDFEKMDLLKFIGISTSRKIYLIYDKKRLYYLDNYLFYDRTQE